MGLEDSLEIITSVIKIYYEERDYLYYVNSLIFYEKAPSYNEFRKQFKSSISNSKVSKKLTKQDKEKRRKENDKILKSFLNKENYEEVNIDGRNI